MNEIEKLTDELLETTDGVKELEALLQEVDVKSNSLNNIEKKVLNKITSKRKQTNFNKFLSIGIVAVAFLTLSTISVHNNLFRAWASQLISYLPMFNQEVDSKHRGTFYELDAIVGEHKDFKIHNLAFNDEMSYFMIEYSYQFKKGFKQEKEFEKLRNEWNKSPKELIINNKKYKLTSRWESYGYTGFISEELSISKGEKIIGKPRNNQIKILLNKKYYTVNLKGVKDFYYPTVSNKVRDIRLKTMINNGKEVLINYLPTNNIRPFSHRPYNAYLTDKKGKRVILKTNENSNTIRYKYKANIRTLDRASLQLITPTISKSVIYNDLMWEVPIPKDENEVIALSPFSLPGTGIVVKGATVKWSDYSHYGLDLSMPKINPKDKTWLLQLEFDENPVMKENIATYGDQSSEKKGYFQAAGYDIQLRDIKQKSIKLKVFCATIIQYGPWVTDLSQVK
jgi:hypothetical protein